MNNEPVAYENTDKEIWREIPDDYYAPSIFVTAQNTIGINVGGSVHVKHVHEWHRLAHPIKEPTDEEILHQNLIWGQQNGEDYSMLIAYGQTTILIVLLERRKINERK